MQLTPSWTVPFEMIAPVQGAATTEICTVAGALVAVPSLTVNVKLSLPPDGVSV